MLTVILDDTVAIFEAAKGRLLEPVLEVGGTVGGAACAPRIEDSVLGADLPLAAAVAARHTAAQDHCQSVKTKGRRKKWIAARRRRWRSDEGRTTVKAEGRQ